MQMCWINKGLGLGLVLGT